ncbi:hypothetical protein O181_116937 [Austropuccinia psidii MF-1]|uniref:Uncharacterized protein n=1 Tax=Austropuccinia psidii MF-1 TaxID=1389203 RepID=A0A9Q3PYX6_9BASI|nr:hypothetical protein [Austropuccinia psidii MF-1]
MPTRMHRPPDETPRLPPNLCPHHSLCFHTPGLTIFMLRWCPPNIPPTLLAILTLVWCPPDTALHPYAWGVPSHHSPNTTYPYPCVMSSRHSLPYLRLWSALPTCS